MRIHQFFDYWAQVQPDADFAVERERRVTWAEAAQDVNRLAAGVIQSGVAVGERVGVLGWNRYESVLTYLAASKAGVVAVPLDARQTPDQWLYVLNDSRVKLLGCVRDMIPAIDALRDDLETVEQFIGGGPEDDGWENYATWGDHDAPPSVGRDVADTDPLVQIYTSGTTGQPKGVVHSHGALSAWATTVDLMGRGRPGERWLMIVPIFHISAICHLLHSVYTGGTLYILPSFDPKETVRVLSEEGIAGVVMGTPMINACLNAVPDAAERSYDSLRLIAYGGAAIAESTLRKAVEAFKCDFVQSYGATECGLVTFLSAQDHRRGMTEKPALLTSAGRPGFRTEFRVVDEDGQQVPPGDVGEIIAQSPQLMTGYWNRPEETAKALREGWYYTGDAGSIDEEGYLYITDRIKDLIVSGGRNVYPVMVENVLHEHPAVAEAAVIRVPDPETGEAVKAVVVLHDGAEASEEELIGFCAGKLAEYQKPTSIDFVDTFPRNAMGKVLKRVLREPYWAGHGRRVGGA